MKPYSALLDLRASWNCIKTFKIASNSQWNCNIHFGALEAFCNALLVKYTLLKNFDTLREILQYRCRVKVILKQESQSTVMRNYTCIFNIYTRCCVYLQPLLPQGVFNIQHINPTCLKFSWTKNIFSNKFLVLRITFSTVVRNQIITFICQI